MNINRITNITNAALTAQVEGWKCPQCKTIWSPHIDRCKECATPSVTIRPTIDWRTPLGGGTEFDISKCPCNPANGGSGICGCTRGGSNVTCTT